MDLIPRMRKDYQRLAISGLPAFFTFRPMLTICLPLGILFGRLTGYCRCSGAKWAYLRRKIIWPKKGNLFGIKLAVRGSQTYFLTAMAQVAA